MPDNRIQKLYQELRRKHGAPSGQWRLWCKRRKTVPEREEIIIGAVLTQNTNWQNVSKAISNLKNAGACSLDKIWRLGQSCCGLSKLQMTIKPAGFYRMKAEYLINVAGYFNKAGGISSVKRQDLETTREQLLALKGVGKETADSILNYALDKAVFVIDAYTKRLVKSRWLARKIDYDCLQCLFEKNVRRGYKFYQDFHALIVINGKSYAKNKN